MRGRKNLTLEEKVKRFIPSKLVNITVWNTCECNLACKYCYVFKLHPNQPRRYMDKKTADAVIEFAKKSLSEGGTIWFFGGEPLMRKEIIKYIVERCVSEGLRFHFGFTTNATLLDEEFIEYMKKYRMSILISLDGPKEKHDKYRVFKDGRGSWDIVFRNLQNLRRLYIEQPQIRWTFAPETLPGLADDIKKFVEEYRLYNIAVDPVFECDWDESDYKRLREEMLRLRNYVLKWYSRGSRVWLKPVRDGIELLKSLYSGRRQWESRCGLAQGSIGVDINGDIFPCHRFVEFHKEREELILGNVFEGFDMKKRIQWIKNWLMFPPVSENKELCRHCIHKPACHGGCIAINYDLFGDVHIVPETVCRINQIIDEVFLPVGIWLYHYAPEIYNIFVRTRL